MPYVGALITFTLILPFTLFIARAANTVCSMSAIISNGLFAFITYSKTDCICLIDSTGDSISNTNGFSNSATLLLGLVIKCEFTKPLSYWTPSIISISVSAFADDSIITIPVSPTSLNASAIIFPSTGSLLVEIVAM